MDAINPAQTANTNTTTTRAPAPSKTASSNDYLSGFPTTPSSSAGLMSALQRTITPHERHRARALNQAAENAARERARALEQQASRIWRAGDVYAPHDMSAVEQMKAKNARNPVARRSAPGMRNSRRHGGADVLDDLAVDPVREYKNYAMMSEFMTEMGRIRHSKETGLRAVNQRKMARAVRRAIGIGIMPSVHRHPELHPDRAGKRARTMGQMDTSAEQGFNAY